MTVDDIIEKQHGVNPRRKENPVGSPLRQVRRWYDRLMANVKADRDDVNFVASLIVTLATIFGGG